MQGRESIRSSVRENYADVAKGGKAGCCTGGCGGDAATASRDASRRAGYTDEDFLGLMPGADMGLGCGNPVALAELAEGETVIDLGSGGGFDCFLASRRVGENGRVIGVDMTPEMVSLARENAAKSGYANVEFYLGEIEHLPVADGVADVVLSNCVVNLSPDKKQAFAEAYRVLRPGGRLCISDVLATKALPESLQKDMELLCACIGGAVEAQAVTKMLEDAGFTRIKITKKEGSKEMIHAWAPDSSAEEYVASFIIRAVKQDQP